MATCVSGSGDHQHSVISSRLSRLFSIIVLPSSAIDVILSIHSQRLQVWLKEMAQSSEHMAGCIITATKNLYHAVCEQFKPTLQKPQFMFSHLDLQKVFQGMYLWQSNNQNTDKIQKKDSEPPVLQGPAGSVLNIVNLWMHECMRTFGDRLGTEDEKKTFVSLVAKVSASHYGIRSADGPYPTPLTVTVHAGHTAPTNIGVTFQQMGSDSPGLPQELEPAEKSDLKEDCALTKPSSQDENSCLEEESLKSHSLQPQILQRLEELIPSITYGPELSATLNSIAQQHNFKCSTPYKDQDLDGLLENLSALIDRKDDDAQQEIDNTYSDTSRFIVHRQRVSQLLHILRALLIPGGHGVLMSSDRNTGRRTNVRLAAYLTGYKLMEVHSGNDNKLHEILKEAGNLTRVDGVNVIILVHEDVRPSVREELLVAMAHRTYPALYTEEELTGLVSRVTAEKNSRRYLMDSWMFDK